MCISSIKVMLHGAIRNDYFSAKQRCNVGTMLYLFEAMLQQQCVALKIVIANRLV